MNDSPPSHLDARDTHSRLPEFSERSVLFFSNLMSLFFGNNQQTAELAKEVGELDSYGGRLIPILNLIYRGSDNLLVLEKEPDRLLCQYFQEILALQLPTLCTSLGEHPERWREHPAGWIDGYATDADLCELANQLGKKTVSSKPGSHLGNNKRLLHEYLISAGLPVVPTVLAETQDEVMNGLAELKKGGFNNAVIRSAVGASGIGMLKVCLNDAAPIVPEYFFFEGACLIQGWLEPGQNQITGMTSPSVQMFLDDDSIQFYDVTEQILSDGSVHQGNASPPSYLDSELREELMRQSDLVANWLHRQGYRGTASTDFLVANHSEGPPDVYVCEINARVTGATYPSVLARHFVPGGAWLMRNLRLSAALEGEQLIEMLKAPGDLFQAGFEKGILPINFNSSDNGKISKGQFLCIGETLDECEELLDFAKFDLPVLFRPDRD